MAGSRPRALLVGVAALGAGILLQELLAFRLWAATFGDGYALLLGLVAPAAVGLGAVVLARGDALSEGAVARAAAKLALGAGAAWIVALVALAWLTQRIARLPGQVGDWALWAMVAGWLVPFALAGGAMGAAVRRGIGQAGRMGFADALGGACAGLAVPLVMRLGAPRAGLVTGLVVGIAAVAFAWSAAGEPGARTPPWGPLWAFVLAAVSLLCGDLGDPWLEMHTDLGSRRSRLRHQVWSGLGLASAGRLAKGRMQLAVDARLDRALDLADGSGRSPPDRPQDLGYGLAGRPGGRVLVIGSGGGREIEVAFSEGAHAVSAIEADPVLVGQLLRVELAATTGRIFRHRGLRVRIGDGRVGAGDLPGGYRQIVVVGAPRHVQAAPRLLGPSDRLYTREAVQGYLSLLAPRGSLVLRCGREGLGSVVAAVAAALGAGANEIREHLFACSAADGEAALLVKREPLSALERQSLSKHCKRFRLAVDFPTEIPMLQIRGHVHERALALLPPALAGVAAAVDEWPYLGARPQPTELPALAGQALRELLEPPWSSLRSGTERPGGPPGRGVVASGKASGRPEPAARDSGAGPGPGRDDVAGRGLGLAAAGLAAPLVLLLAGLALATAGSGRRQARPAAALALACFGVALGVAQVALAQRLIEVLGQPAAAWPLVIPLLLVATGAGRLVVDSVSEARVRRMAAWCGAAAALCALAASLMPLGSVPAHLRPAALAVVAMAVAALLGAPLAAALRLAGRRGPRAAPAVAAGLWGAHALGWAVGAAAAAVLVRYAGTSRLLAAPVFAVVPALLLLELGRAGGGAGSVARSAPSSDQAA
ncbi:MAG: hypothetical protein HY744_25005 [Deltaproteobacteria bacterium]|nr:hypothetical protein [Deltaproteobacteria bacterium]